jgi:hypothetical protein
MDFLKTLCEDMITIHEFKLEFFMTLNILISNIDFLRNGKNRLNSAISRSNFH